jgi:hypothetical protein
MNDKLKHFLACAVIAWIALGTCNITSVVWYGWDAAVAAGVVFFAAGAKEAIWDYWLKKGTPDYYDFFWGICGGWAGIFIWKIVETIIYI